MMARLGLVLYQNTLEDVSHIERMLMRPTWHYQPSRQDPVDTPETKEGHEPSDKVTNALKYKDMVNDDNNDVNDTTNHIGIVDAPLPRAWLCKGK